MAFCLEDSLGSALDYDAEVAYIALTSPVRGDTSDPATAGSDGGGEDEEFDFSMDQVGATRDNEISLAISPPPREATSPPPREACPPLMSKLKSPRPTMEEVGVGSSRIPSPHGYRERRSLSPLALPDQHFVLDTEAPNTPRAKLRQIKEAQAPPPSPSKGRLKLDKGLYTTTLVLYGSSGCGRTYLVDKLAHSNPSLFSKVVPTTTRKRRANEVSGVDFHYLSPREMSLSLARGEFIEYIQVQRRGKNTRHKNQVSTKIISRAQQSSLKTGPPPADSSPLPTTSFHRASTFSTALEPGVLVAGKRCESLFDLTEEDSPVVGGEMFGTSYQALAMAIQQGKPAILINASTRGAQQLKKVGLKASYILVQSDPAHHTDGTLHPDYIISSSSLDQAYSDLHQYALEQVADLNLPTTSKYEVAKYDWEATPTVEFEQDKPLPHHKSAEVSFSELLVSFNRANLKDHLRAKSIHTTPGFFKRGAKLSKKLLNEKLLVQAVAFCPLNDKDRLHIRALQTIHSKLTGNNLSCRRFGSHWVETGFSGVDPVDDLLDVGMLGLTQLIYFLENTQTFRLCKEIFHYCHRDTHTIPFCVLAFSFTQLSLEALEKGVLNKLCNKRDQVFVVVNEFYMSSLHYYYTMWKAGRKSILQLGLLMQQCGDYCKEHPREVMQLFDNHLSIREPSNQLIPTLLSKGFTPFEEITSSLT